MGTFHCCLIRFVQLFTEIMKSIKDNRNKTDEVDKILQLDVRSLPYMPSSQQDSGSFVGHRTENPVVFLEFAAMGGRTLRSGEITAPSIIGKLYFELRRDLVPVACSNFLDLCSGVTNFGNDGINYHFKGTKIHRIVKNELFEGGDLLGMNGLCSRSIYDGRLFRDENYILRHAGPGCLSMASRGPDTNGSLFLVTFSRQQKLDEKCVVFGCLANQESFDILMKINEFGTTTGEPLEEIRIIDCGIAYE